MTYIYNPKTKGSGIITCIPQTGICPNKCDDCFFQSGRSYLEPLEENLPQIPSKELAKGRIVRINDGNDSNNQRELVEQVAQQFDDYFFNTSMPDKLEEFSGPVVLTINPGRMTDEDFYGLYFIPNNLMYVKVRTNTWNIDSVVKLAVDFYTARDICVMLTFMAYFTLPIPEQYRDDYIWKKRTLNSYWCLKQEKIDEIANLFKDNPLVDTCGKKGRYECKYCGNCFREYYRTKEKMRTL